MAHPHFWSGRRVLVTGHTGFKGGWLSQWLLELGAKLAGYALPPEHELCTFSLCGLAQRMDSTFADIRDQRALDDAIASFRPEVIFHLAAQPLVRRSYNEPALTFEVNVLGTLRLLEAARRESSVQAMVVVTSDKCYAQETRRPHKEDDPLGGHDPYSASKACAEIVCSSYARSVLSQAHAPALATARAGNVIGGGDWNEDRLVPDAIRALTTGRPLLVRNPDSIRPWHHVLEPLRGYLLLAEHLLAAGSGWHGAWNFGPNGGDGVTVASLADLVIRRWGSGSWQRATLTGAPHEAATLSLDCSKACVELGWHPRLPLAETIAMTVDWYRTAVTNPTAIAELTTRQIDVYQRLSARGES